MPEAEDNHQASWKYSLLSKETVLADTGKAGDMIRAMDSTSLTAGVNEYRASQFSWDAEGELTVNSPSAASLSAAETPICRKSERSGDLWRK